MTRLIPFGEAVTVRPITLEASDGIRLAATVYSAGERADMTVLMLPGIGVPQRAFRHLARWLAARGARCVTLDYRGMGCSVSGAGTASASLSTWARRDAAAAFEYASRTWPAPVALLGHSFGGQAVGLSETLHDAVAAVFIGSQFGQARYWDGAARWRLALYWRVVLPLASAAFTVLPRWTGPAGPLPRGVAREWARWGRSADWYVSSEPGAARLLRQFGAPILAYGIADDDIAPPRAVSAFLERFRATVPVRRDVRPDELRLERLGHVGLLKPLAETSAIWNEILEFLREAVGAGRRAAASDTR